MKKITRLLCALAAACAIVSGSTSAVAAQGDLFAGGLETGAVYRVMANGTFSVFATVPYADAIAFDAAGNLYVADPMHSQILRIPAGTTTAAVFYSQAGFIPSALAFDPSGVNLYVSDAASGTVFKFVSGTPTSFATGIGGPNGLAFDSQGNLYVSENNTGSVLKFTPGGVRSTYASGFSTPQGLVVDAAGNVYEADVGTASIFKITAPNTKTQFSTGLNTPRFLALDQQGNLFVSTPGNNSIMEIGPGGGAATTFASGIRASGLAFQPVSGGGGLLSNISTRASVQTGDRVEIGGFIITGSNVKTVLIRALGPTLGRPPFNVGGSLQDPFLELHDGSGALIAANDDWAGDPNAGQIPPGLQPPDSHESALVRALQPGNYTAIVHSANNTSTGIGLVEVYDIDTSNPTFLGNISTRAFVGTGDSVMIGGFIVASGDNARVLVRALGPTLSQPPFNLAGVLADPTLQLLDMNGNQIAFNNDWRDTQAAEIQATGNPPPNNLESAIVATLPPNNYTAIVQGNGGGTGIGLVEVYNVR